VSPETKYTATCDKQAMSLAHWTWSNPTQSRNRKDEDAAQKTKCGYSVWGWPQ